jgi:hypothetical protein
VPPVPLPSLGGHGPRSNPIIPFSVVGFSKFNLQDCKWWSTSEILLLFFPSSNIRRLLHNANWLLGAIHKIRDAVFANFSLPILTPL